MYLLQFRHIRRFRRLQAICNCPNFYKRFWCCPPLSRRCCSTASQEMCIRLIGFFYYTPHRCCFQPNFYSESLLRYSHKRHSKQKNRPIQSPHFDMYPQYHMSGIGGTYNILHKPFVFYLFNRFDCVSLFFNCGGEGVI